MHRKRHTCLGVHFPHGEEPLAPPVSNQVASCRKSEGESQAAGVRGTVFGERVSLGVSATDWGSQQVGEGLSPARCLLPGWCWGEVTLRYASGLDHGALLVYI